MSGRRKVTIPAKQMTSAILHEWFDYNRETGIFVWKKSPFRQPHKAGSIAGYVTFSGYIYIGFCGGRYFAHRLAWLYSHGSWPAQQIDHVDGQRANNALANLREATPSENMCNRISSGFSYDNREGRYRASLGLNRKTIWLGYFDTAEEARSAHSTASEKYFGEFSAIHRRPQ